MITIIYPETPDAPKMGLIAIMLTIMRKNFIVDVGRVISVCSLSVKSKFSSNYEGFVL